MTINNKNSTSIEIYQLDDGSANLEIRVEHNTLWLSQAQLATLFDKDTDTIGLHLKNIYKEGELDEKQLPRNPR